MSQVEIAIVGAGIAGLTCARELQQAGHQVVILEKSRGVGGRMATRRLHNTRADHGTCYLSPKGAQLQALMTDLAEKGIVQIWTDRVYDLGADGVLQAPVNQVPRYVAAAGMNAIAKSLVPNLDIRFSQRVVGLEQTPDHTWNLALEVPSPDASTPTIAHLAAKAVVVTAPAPQAVDLLAPLEETALSVEFLAALRSVEFTPCIAVMAGYAPECLQDWQTQFADVKAIAFAGHAGLGWIGLDSSKRAAPTQPVFVVQSTAGFAQTHLDDEDLTLAGRSLLASAAALLIPWLATPEWMQVHRWRYAFSSRPLAQPYLASASPLLVCAGDWCGGDRVENALLSGLAAARYLNSREQ